MAKHLFTSESVTEGHPDKICDQISDAVLDAIMEKDPQGRAFARGIIDVRLALGPGARDGRDQHELLCGDPADRPQSDL